MRRLIGQLAILLTMLAMVAVLWTLGRRIERVDRLRRAGRPPAVRDAGRRLPEDAGGVSAAVPGIGGTGRSDAPPPGGRAAARAATQRVPRADAAERDVIPNEYVLSFYNDRDRDAFVAAARRQGAVLLDRMAFAHTVRLSVPSRAVLDALIRDGPAPVDMAPNRYVRIPAPVTGKNPQAPDGAYLGFGATALDWLGVPERIGDWGRGVQVALIDGGVGAHPALRGVALTRAAIGSGDDAAAEAPSVHGTAVASLIAGRGAGVDGMAPAAALVSYGIMAADGTGDLYALVAAIVDAVDRGCAVVNISLGAYASNYLLDQAVAYARAQGTVLVAAAGNDAVEGLLYPAALDGVVAVAAVDGAGRHPYFSNRGAQVGLAAPGVGVAAAALDGATTDFSGTSAAVPFVVSAIAALMSQDAGMTASEAVAVLIANADDHGAPDVDPEFGHGILNMDRVANRNTAGIVDIAVGDPWLDDAADAPGVWLYVQNRGTAAVRTVTLAVEIDGVPNAAVFYDVAPGRTASRRFALNQANLEHYGQVTVVCRATAEGVQDVDPNNNVRRGVVRAAQ